VTFLAGETGQGKKGALGSRQTASPVNVQCPQVLLPFEFTWENIKAARVKEQKQ